MQMNASSIVNQKAEWEKLGVKLPAFDHAAMTAATKEHLFGSTLAPATFSAVSSPPCSSAC